MRFGIHLRGARRPQTITAPRLTEDRLLELLDDLKSRELTISLDGRTERRLRAYIARFNRDVEADERLDPNRDEDIHIALLLCAERGLDLHEYPTRRTPR